MPVLEFHISTADTVTLVLLDRGVNVTDGAFAFGAYEEPDIDWFATDTLSPRSIVNVAKSIFAAVTAPSSIAAVVTEPVGRGAFNKSPRVIFLVTDAEVSTIAISSELSAVVSDDSWLILGINLPSLSYYGVSSVNLIIIGKIDGLQFHYGYGRLPT